MGMYDYVKYSAPCKSCGKILTEWQTKDGDCQMNTLEPDPKLISRWYGSCQQCGTWNAKRFQTTPIIEDEPD